MADATINKSAVMWYPDPQLSIPHISEWTSMCLFHEQVVVARTFPLEEEEKMLKRFVSDGVSRAMLALFIRSLVATREDMLKKINGSNIDETPVTEQDLSPRIVFNETLKMLAKEGVVKILVSDDIKGLDQSKLSLKVERRILQSKPLKEGTITAGDALFSYAFARIYNYPIVTDDVTLFSDGNELIETTSETIARCAISELVLPDVSAIYIEDLLEARTELKDELSEFRAGILNLTWLLHQQVGDKNDLEEIRKEANVLVNTKIKAALLSLENRIRQHKKKSVRRLLFGTGRVLVEATKLFLPSGAAEKMISGGKSLLQIATEVDSAKPPEDQIATYIYRLRGKLHKKD